MLEACDAYLRLEFVILLMFFIFTNTSDSSHKDRYEQRMPLLLYQELTGSDKLT